jgi:hypothetical protein
VIRGVTALREPGRKSRVCRPERPKTQACNRRDRRLVIFYAVFSDERTRSSRSSSSSTRPLRLRRCLRCAQRRAGLARNPLRRAGGVCHRQPELRKGLERERLWNDVRPSVYAASALGVTYASTPGFLTCHRRGTRRSCAVRPSHSGRLADTPQVRAHAAVPPRSRFVEGTHEAPKATEGR